MFKKAAWLAALLCFSLFSFITLSNGLTGAASCGCFGSVHLNPWILPKEHRYARSARRHWNK
ncbi:MAG: hypothetical protein ACYTEL_17165 [Planctomycetota bacterium]